ncbi:MAG: hypothetical protein KTR18_11130 [Acidiferrobacterales bacterium]|nr:hypothetical protein [Acidiferrobacterales bacterium]
MAIRLVVIGAILLAFGLGYFLATPDENTTVILKQQLTKEVNKNKVLQDNIDELSQTLGLVRRQVQTDRIAYESLKKDVERSEEQRTALQEKFESQRELLERLKKKIETL